MTSTEALEASFATFAVGLALEGRASAFAGAPKALFNDV